MIGVTAHELLERVAPPGGGEADELVVRQAPRTVR